MPLSELMDFDAFLCLKGMPLATSSRAPATLAHWHIGIFLLGADEVFVQATEQEFGSHCRGWGILGKNRYQYQEHIILNHDSHVWDALLFILCNNVPWTWLLDFGAMAGTRWLRKCENVDDAGTRTNSIPPPSTTIHSHKKVRLSEQWKKTLVWFRVYTTQDYTTQLFGDYKPL